MTIKKLLAITAISTLIPLSIISVEGFSQTVTEIQSDNKLSSNIDTVIHAAVSQFFDVKSRVGMSMALFYKGQAFFYNYGSSEKAKSLLPSRNTIYEIGSITKTFGAVLLSQAVVDRKIKVDDDIRIHLEEEYPNLEYKGIPVKLYQLLNHSSGLPYDFIDRKSNEKINPDARINELAEIENSYSQKQLLKDLHTVRLDTVPGIRLSYSNVAAQLLGFILERVYRRPYPTLISKYITGKLKLLNTGFQVPLANIKNVANGYNKDGLEMAHIKNGAAGGLFSTADDLLSYGKFHLNEDNPIIKLTHEPTWGQIQYYAVGLNWQMQQKEKDYRRIWQSGSTAGFTSLLSVYPELDIVFVFLTNEHDENSEGALSMVEQSILNVVNDKSRLEGR
jgi:CubicO group peptidase (beta-lactamase class C family)